MHIILSLTSKFSDIDANPIERTINWNEDKWRFCSLSSLFSGTFDACSTPRADIVHHIRSQAVFAEPTVHFSIPQVSIQLPTMNFSSFMVDWRGEGHWLNPICFVPMCFVFLSVMSNNAQSLTYCS